MTQPVKQLLCKHEDLNSDLQYTSVTLAPWGWEVG